MAHLDGNIVPAAAGLSQTVAMISLLPKLIASTAVRFMHVGAIATCIAAMWSATRFLDYQDTIRAGACAAFGGGSSRVTHHFARAYSRRVRSA